MANKLIDKEEDIQQAAQAIKAIAHPLRLKILCVLGDQEISVQDIVDQVGTSQSNISQHLAILRGRHVKLPESLRSRGSQQQTRTPEFFHRRTPIASLY